MIRFLNEYDLIVATSGKEALNIINADNSIDLILLDIMMPNMDGFEVCEHIKKDPIYSSIPVMFLTAKLDDNSIEKAFEVGGVDYIVKPFRPIELMARIKTQLKLIKQQKELALKDKYLALRDLIGNISHQWKQPLSVITTSVSGMMIQKELNYLNDEDFYQFCHTTLDSCDYLASTVEQFRILLEDRSKSYINLRELIFKNSTSFIKEEEQIEFIIDIDPSIKCYANEVDILSIIQTLINNSIEVLQNLDEKLIFISVSQEHDQIVFNFFDNGGGIATSIIDKIFEPYFTTEHRSLGKGLNLFKVYLLVTYSLKGEIEVENKKFQHKNKEYKGAHFEITFPVNH